MATTLTVRILSDASRAGAGFTEAESRVDRFNRRLDQSSVAAGGVLATLGVVGVAAYKSASQLEQSTGAMEAVFGAQSAAMNRLAQNAATKVGLAQSEYAGLASVLGSQLTNMGVAADELMPHTNSLISRGADLAAQFGGSTSQAVEALSSLLRGERDPIERYGISISQAALDAKMAAMGLDTHTEAAKKNAQFMATLALVSEQTKTANGAFAREADTAAGATQRAAAQFENAKAALGTALLPVVAEAATKFSGLTSFLTDHTGTVQALAVVVGSLALAVIGVNAALTVYRTITAVATAMQWLFNVAMSANPIGLIILAIIGVIALVVTLYNKFDWFRAGVKVVADLVLGYINLWMAPIKWVVDKLGWVKSAAGAVGGLFSAPAGGGGGGAGGVLMGAARGASAAAAVGPVYGAAPSGGGVGGSSGGLGVPAQVTVNVEMTGAVIDPVAAGRQLVGVLRDYGIATGNQVTLVLRR